MTTKKNILLLGNGFVAQPCAEIVLRRAENSLTIASRSFNHSKALSDKLNQPGRVFPVAIDVSNEIELNTLISKHDLVISLIPYTFHATVIKAAIKSKKDVVTTSYVNPQMAALHEEAAAAGITVMNEIGVDPGIDHLYAVKTIDEVHGEGGKILSFVSYCGGLPAPECSNNPLGYKFSWSSRGVLLALRNTARIVENGKHVEIPGPQLMRSAKPRYTGYPAFAFVGYPNRDSTPYSERYNIPEAQTVIRGTLRYEGFPVFIQALVDIGFLDDSHYDGFKTDLTWRQLTASLCGLNDSSENLEEAVMKKAGFDKLSAHDKQHVMMGFKWLGLFSLNKVIPRASNILDTLCAVLEEKMMYEDGERDLLFLQHEFEIERKDKTKYTLLSTLLEYGVPNGTTAMAKLVGVPCGIATQLVLDGVIKKKGVIAPMSMDICTPLIEALKDEGITMKDTII